MEQWLWSLFGVTAFNFLIFTISKDEYDNENKKFSLKRYANKHWDNWVWSFMCIPLVAVYGEQIWYYIMNYFEKDWDFLDVVYTGGGALSMLIYWVVKKILVAIKAVGK